MLRFDELRSLTVQTLAHFIWLCRKHENYVDDLVRNIKALVPARMQPLLSLGLLRYYG